MKKYLIPLILLAVIGFGYFWYKKNAISEEDAFYATLKCPDDYTDLDEKARDLDRFIVWWNERHPDAGPMDWGEGRTHFFRKRNCTEALARLGAYENGTADPATLKLLDEIIVEELERAQDAK